MAVTKTWYTVSEAAEYLGISRRTVYNLSKESRLRTYVLGKERIRRFRKEDLDRVPRLLKNRDEDREIIALTGLSAASDPVLADLWENDRDAAYDTL